MNKIDEQKIGEELNPFTGIWLKTRETVRFVIEKKEWNFIWLLIFLSGTSAGLLGVLDTDLNVMMPLWRILLLAVLVGPILGIIGHLVASGIFLLVGKLLKGRASYPEMFKAVVTSQIPQICILPVLLLWMLYSPTTFFAVSWDEPSLGGNILALFLSIVLLVVSVWTFVVQCKAVGEAHRLSSWKGFFIILIPMIFIILLVLVVAFGFFTFLL
ncbi:YIP1 family protein [Planococcus salinus]|uniref:YIP1 family protein n=1 Tax=Planococcus salinus TaxID=1848460 RepID=A0A3M8P7Q6_9BACL|nr:YIP1 family protein [Planococcus salinus]RNF39728.1 YIP1 family protein [Planococcus salinus]